MKETNMLFAIRLRFWGLLLAGLVVCAMVAPEVYAVTSGEDKSLVLHYMFDYPDTTGYSGPRVVKDHSPYGNDGEIVQIPESLREVHGRRGVLRFGGEKTFINCGDSESLYFGGDMSFEMWVRLIGIPKTSWAMVFGDDRNFNLKKLDLGGKKLDVFNVLTNEHLAMSEEGKLSVELGSEHWMYVWLRPAK